MRRLERSRVPPVVWGLVGFALVALTGLLVFTGTSTVSKAPFELRAVFRSDAQVTVRSPVRIAGVDVGHVTKVQPLGGGSDAAVVVMAIDDRAALPLHRDATVRLRSRLLLEGNFSVELSPGSPAAPALRSGATIGADHTSGPVQLDRVLSDLPADVRLRLQSLIRGAGDALDRPVDGETAAQSLNDALADWPAALRGLGITTRAMLGTRPRDLSRLVSTTSRVTAALASREHDLADLIANFQTTMAATASRQDDLAQTIRLLPGVLVRAEPALAKVDRSLPSTRAFATRLSRSIVALPAAIHSGLPWMTQARALLRKDELGGLLADLTPGVRDTAATLDGFGALLRQLELLDRCAIGNLLPTGDVVISDPPLKAGATVQQELFQTIAGAASAAQNFDGNGHYVRAQPGGGDVAITTSALPDQGPLRGNATATPLGTRPAYPGAAPAYRTDVACADNARPDLNSAKTGAGP
jgi:ABC-type transporter Mla subunit MlaD